MLIEHGLGQPTTANTPHGTHVVVIGDGKLVVPVDFAIRRPDPPGPGAPCRDKLHWAQIMLDGRIAALRWRGVHLPPPIVVAG